MWRKLPLTKYLIHKSKAVIVHNFEILQLAKQIYPSINLFNISDPIAYISSAKIQKRHDHQILVISSFDPWDEPVELLIKTVGALKDYTFVITAEVNKLPPQLREQLQQMENVRLTGFLPTKEYHELLCSSLAALVLTTSDATQPSGACEALSSDTQLVISKTSLTEKLYGEWAVLVDNSLESIVEAIHSLSVQEIDLALYRKRWNDSVKQEIARLNKYIEELIVN
jgi:glycosyltransferase involved in cell wall biosynthesis